MQFLPSGNERTTCLCPDSYWCFRSNHIRQPLIWYFTAIVQVPAIEHSGRGDDVTIFIPFTATGDGANDVEGVGVTGGDVAAIFVDKTSSIKGSDAGRFIRKAEEGGSRGCEEFFSH